MSPLYYSSEQFYKDWRYGIAEDFQTDSGSSFGYAKPDGHVEWGSEQKKLTFDVETLSKVVASHDGFVKDRLFADVAAVGAIRTDGGAVGEKQEVRVGRYLVSTFRALKAVNVEEGLSGERDHGEYRQ